MEKVSRIQLGRVLKQLIDNEPGLTVTRLADEIGANRNTIDNIIYDGAIPRGLKTVVKISERFDLTLDQVIFGEGKGGLNTDNRFRDTELVQISFNCPVTVQLLRSKAGPLNSKKL